MSKLSTFLGERKIQTSESVSGADLTAHISLKDKKALVIDHGMFTEMAAALKNQKNGFGEVLYYTPVNHDTLSSVSQKIGLDFKGLTRVNSIWDNIDKVDVVVCFDTYEGDLLSYLRNLGYSVWGGGKAEDLELKRWETRQLQSEIGLPVQQSLKITSLDDLKLYFQGIRNKVREDTGRDDESTSKAIMKRIRDKYEGFSDKYYIGDKRQLEKEFMEGAKSKYFKANMRGDIESAFAPDYKGTVSKFNALYEKLGHRANADEVEFIVEGTVKGVEPGWDGVQVNGEPLSPSMWGIEHKERGYIGRILDYDKLPEVVRELNGKVLDVIRERYQPSASFMSLEFIIDEARRPFLIDPCIRNASPVPSAIFSELYENLPEIIWNGAHGIPTKPRLKKAKYAAGVSFCSDWAKDHEMEIEYPEDMIDRVKFIRSYSHNGSIYALPGESVVCTAIGFGDTVEEAMKEVRSVADKIKGYQLSTNTGGLDGVLDDIEELEESTGEKF